MICIGIILFLFTLFLKKEVILKEEEKEPTICFLVPARNESKVIEPLLYSILHQTIPIIPNDIYVIVEDKGDPTVSICQKYGISVIVRKNLDKRTKGYALDEGLKNINKKYDLYFIMDADNVMEAHFVEEMLKSYRSGYDIATGYRNVKNGNDSLISAASGLTFSFLNNVLNKGKIKRNLPVTLSGTGFYIKGDILNKMDGYPFCSLTEDYELSLYSVLQQYKTTYNEKAIFYDEQPVLYKNTINQRKRWVKGYFVNRFHYLPLLKKEWKNTRDVSILGEWIGIKPCILIVLGILFWLIYFMAKGDYLFILFSILLIYFALCFLTYIILKIDKNISLSKKRKRQMIWFHPIYLASYLHVVLLVFLHPNVKWDRVEHNRNLNI